MPRELFSSLFIAIDYYATSPHVTPSFFFDDADAALFCLLIFHTYHHQYAFRCFARDYAISMLPMMLLMITRHAAADAFFALSMPLLPPPLMLFFADACFFTRCLIQAR